ncbi:hypothetical protein niasHT_039358 [Heterodera trifolii]|uniref:DNA-directed DNA polymerase n=1 Tax=Heterodera trifolii TaxID=157864 RepID=A0ABD2J573_9BILA
MVPSALQARHGSGRSQQRRHPQVHFSSFATSVRFQFVNSGDASQIHFSPFAIFIHYHHAFYCPRHFRVFSKEYGEFSTGHFDPNRAYDPNSLGELSKWRKEFLDGRYGSKQPTPPSTPRSPSLSFPIPVIVGRQMFPGDDGYESEDDEILLPPPPIPPQIDPPSPNVPAVRVQPMHVGQQRLPLRDLPQFDYHPPNVPEITVGLIHDGHQPMPLRVLPQIAHRQLIFPAVRVQPMQQGQEPLPLRDMPQFDPPPPNVPAIRVQPVQQPIPLRDVQIFGNPPPNVPAVRVQPVQQPMPLRDMPQIHHPPRNVTSIWIKLWLLFLSLWVFLQAIHVRQIQHDYAIPQFGHQPLNVPLIFDHPPVMFGNSTTATTATAERRATIRPPAAARTGLFYALEFSRNYQLIDHGISRKAFRYLLQTEKKQRELTIELMEKAGISTNGKTFGIQHLEIVQKLWDAQYSNTFRIVAFEMKTRLKPIFKGEGVRRNEVCVIRDGDHWDGIKSASWFFGVRYFCVDCEVTYDRPERHRMECKQRCKKCCRMGFGFPCTDVCDGIYCGECNLKFYNPECFEAHKKAACKEYKKCEKCLEAHNTRNKHTCGEKLMFETVAFAHYAGRFDSHFVLSELTKKEIATELMMADLKIYQIKAGRVIFRDFWMLSQNKLADLPKTLGLNIAEKLYFPHKYNKNENFGKRSPNLPPLEDYCPDNMKEEKCQKLEKWYNENFQTEFELGEQLKVYCENDVEILMQSVLKFRQLFLEITGDFDVMKDSVTITGVVMKIFRAKFLRDRHIPIMPEGGYERAENQSKIAVRYFEWLAQRKGVKVRHACNGGEVEFGGLKECDVNAELKKNNEMKKFFESVPDKGPINPRDAYAGGENDAFLLVRKGYRRN